MRKTLKTSGKPGDASVYFYGQRPAIVTSGAGCHDCLAETHRIAIRRRRCVCVGGGGCVCARVRAGACVRAFVRAFVRVCVRA